MKKLIIILCGLMVSGVVIAEPNWRFFDKKVDGTLMYIAMDPTNSHAYWVKLIPKNNDLSQKFQSKGYSYMVNHVSVNCSSNNQTLDSLLIYDVHNKLVYKQAVNSTRTLPAGTPGDKLIKFFCRKK